MTLEAVVAQHGRLLVRLEQEVRGLRQLLTSQVKLRKVQKRPGRQTARTTEMKRLVLDWCDTFTVIMGRQTSDSFGKILVVLRRLVQDYGEAKVRATVAQYWDYCEKEKRSGSLMDYRNRFDLLYDVCKKRGDKAWEE